MLPRAAWRLARGMRGPAVRHRDGTVYISMHDTRQYYGTYGTPSTVVQNGQSNQFEEKCSQAAKAGVNSLDKKF
jgi:hypothetical protein